MTFASENVKNIQIYQLPQSVYNTMLQNGTIDANAFYLTTGGEETTHSHMVSKTNVSVAASTWTSGSTYTDYPYQATISINGVTSQMVPDVTFGLVEAASGNFAPVAQTTTNGVIIYAKAKPTASITIPAIICHILEE